MPRNHRSFADPKTHMRHAGKCGDVFKHFALAAALDHYVRMCGDEQNVIYIDTHAGRGLYNLKGHKDRAIFEVPFEHMPSAFQEVADRTFLGGFYPGSPTIAAHFLRREDRIVFCETNSDEMDLLTKYVGNSRGREETYTPAWFVREDGFTAALEHLNSLPSVGHTSILFMDPTYEDPDDWTRVAYTAERAARLRPETQHTTIIWYPVIHGQRSEVDQLHRRLADTAHRDGGTLIHQEIRVGREPGSQMVGAGMFFVKVFPGLDQALRRAILAGDGIYDLTVGNLFTGARA